MGIAVINCVSEIRVAALSEATTSRGNQPARPGNVRPARPDGGTVTTTAYRTAESAGGARAGGANRFEENACGWAQGRSAAERRRSGGPASPTRQSGTSRHGSRRVRMVTSDEPRTPRALAGRPASPRRTASWFPSGTEIGLGAYDAARNHSGPWRTQVFRTHRGWLHHRDAQRRP